MKKQWMLIALVYIIAMLSACSSGKETSEQADKTAKQAEKIYKENQVNKSDTLVTRSKQVFLAKSPFEIIKQEQLPPVFSKHILYTASSTETVSTTIDQLARLTNVPMIFQSDTLDQLTISNKDVSGVVTYQGSLSHALDDIANRYGLYWKYDNGKVMFFGLETKVYALDAPTGTFTINDTVTSSNISSGDSGSSGSSTTISGTSAMNLTYNFQAASPWVAAVKTMTNMLSSKGKLTDNPGDGYVTVTDNPNIQKQIADYVKHINDRTNKKIAVKVDVFDVQTSATSDFGMNMDAFVGVLSDQASIVTDNTQTLSDATLSTITFQSSSDSTHNLVLKALNTIGKATEVTGATVYTVSGQPAPIQSVTQQTYLASMSTTTTTDAGTTSSMEPGTVVTGYSMMVTPKIQSNNQIMINLNLQLSTLLSLTSITTPPTDSGTVSSMIQAPKIHSKSFLENMILHSGQSLLIAGFQDESANADTSAPGSADYWIAGGAKSTSKVKSTTVIVITPYVIGD